MNCEELHTRLLDFVDGDLPSEEKAAVRAHLAGCPSCRAEVEQLRAGARAVREAVETLATRQRYLTPARLDALRAARRQQNKPLRLITMRRLVAAAAIAAIVAAAPFLVGDIQNILNPPPAAQNPQVAQAPAPGWHGTVILAATGRQGPMSPLSVLRPVPVAAGASQAVLAPAPRMNLAGSDSPGVRVPVNSALYDPVESSHWW
jgi:anti-sigma factor RsiW